MRSLVLGAFIVASFGLPANAAEPSDTKAANAHARRPACHEVTADRRLRLLHDILPEERRVATDRPMSRPVATPAKEPVVKVSRPATPVRVASRPQPIRLVSRAEPVRLPTQHLSLMVGVSF
jgi:hypothetical protein